MSKEPPSSLPPSGGLRKSRLVGAGAFRCSSYFLQCQCNGSQGQAQGEEGNALPAPAGSDGPRGHAETLPPRAWPRRDEFPEGFSSPQVTHCTS